MAKRYINYDELLETRHRLGLDEMSKIHKVNAFNQFIDNLPTADVVEVKYGEWLEEESGLFYCCTNCGYIVDYQLTSYCPNCGAKMDGGNAE